MELGLPVIIGLVSGLALFIIISLTFPFIQSNEGDTQTVWMSYSPKQCEDAPWIVEGTKFPPYNDTKSYYNAIGLVAAEYYRQQGISVYHYAINMVE